MRFLIDEHMGPSAARWLVSSWFDFSSLPHVRDVPIGIQVWRLERALGVGEGGFSVANLGSTNVGPLRGRQTVFGKQRGAIGLCGRLTPLRLIW